MHTSIRSRIERGFEAFGHLVYRNHWKALLLIGLLLAVLLSQLPKLTLDTSTEGFLHKNDPILLAYDKFRQQYGRDELALVAIKTGDIFAPEFLSRLKSLHEELRDNTPYLDDITSLINARSTHGTEGELIVEDLLEKWPENAADIERIRQLAMANPLYTNMLLSADSTITTIIIKADAYPGSNSDDDIMAGFGDEGEVGAANGDETAERVPLSDAQNSELVQTVRKITTRYQGDNFEIYLAGSPAVTDVLKRSMMSSMKKFMLIAIATIGLLLFLLFRRAAGVVLPLLTVAISLLSTLGLMGASGIAFKLPTQILPSFLLAVGVGASVHLLTVFFREMQELYKHDKEGADEDKIKERAIVEALGHSGLAIVMTSLTTAAGLASFAGAEVAPVSDLGIVAAIGVLLSLLYTLVLIPALLSVTPLRPQKSQGAHRQHEFFETTMKAIARIATERSGTVLIISAILLVIGIAGTAQVKFSHKPFEWLPKSEPVRVATDFINDKLRGASSVEVIIDTGKVNGLYEPKLMQGLERLNRDIETIDQGELYVGKTLSLADILKEIHQALNENGPEFYTIPDDKNLIAQEFLLFENSGSDDLEDFVDSQFSQSRFTAKMPWVDAMLYPDFIADLQQRFHHELGEDVDVTVTGMATLLGRTASGTIISMTQSYIIAGVVITLMMILLLGDIRIGLISMIPNLTPIILTLGMMGWFGIDINLFTMLIGSIAIGLAVDDTIHFMHNYRRYHHDTGDVHLAVEKTLLTTGRAMLVTTIVLSTAFFLYMLADLNVLFDFGLLTGFTILMALLADLFLAPALMARMHKLHLIADDSDY
jgi:predicted RND superfamily exporter protein